MLEPELQGVSDRSGSEKGFGFVICRGGNFEAEASAAVKGSDKSGTAVVILQSAVLAVTLDLIGADQKVSAEYIQKIGSAHILFLLLKVPFCQLRQPISVKRHGGSGWLFVF